jgi:hypothetical protein
MNQFAERYKKLSNADLLKIIDTPANYQPLAIDAAHDEVINRQLSEEDLFIARADNEIKLQEQQKKSNQVEEFQNKAKNFTRTVADTLNPIQETTPSTDRIILWISILMGILFLYQAYMQYGLLVYLFKYAHVSWTFGMVTYFLRMLIAPFAAVLFALRKKSGWVLLSMYFTYLALNTIGMLAAAIKNGQYQHTSLNGLLPATPVSSLLGWAIFNAGCLYFIYKKEVRELYEINMQGILVAITFGMALSLTAMV